MARLPISLVEASPTGLVALASDADFHIADRTGKVVASTADGVASSAVHIGKHGTGAIRAAAFSRDGALFAACTTEKAVTIYRTDDWSVVRTHEAEKRTNAIAFDPSGAFLLTADKFGDVHRIPTAAPAPSAEVAMAEDGGAKAKTEPLLGHVSILCDVAVSYGPRPFVLTCDRDEKLRVSRYPNAYNIQAFGLGHKEFVTSVATAQFAPDIAVTGAGDGTVRLWDIASGRLLQTVELEGILSKYYADGRAVCDKSTREDRTAGAERYGVLRVRAAEDLRQFVVVVERIPVVVILPFSEGPGLDSARVVDIASPPADVAVLGDRVIVAYAPAAPGPSDLVVVLSPSSSGSLAVDETLGGALNALPTAEVDVVPQAPSIFVWGGKAYLDRPGNEDDGDGGD
ncbi:hypothetical protein LPJ61_002749 [Coemansia biformis]|uniref:tRNA (guanine-N(7)-)-methyltransferase non-catalytic subunit TRM82 n=1 Tax=Coemansia biformis TaxID=1286918 RepID=A0A9W7YBW1_9FUNG|nr:hypothetical protein LPJ61_002749 [Coemansia biformis]